MAMPLLCAFAGGLLLGDRLAPSGGGEEDPWRFPLAMGLGITALICLVEALSMSHNLIWGDLRRAEKSARFVAMVPMLAGLGMTIAAAYVGISERRPEVGIILPPLGIAMARFGMWLYGWRPKNGKGAD